MTENVFRLPDSRAKSRWQLRLEVLVPLVDFVWTNALASAYLFLV